MGRSAIAAILAVFWIQTGCDGFGTEVPGQPTDGTIPIVVDAPTYVDHIAPMMETYCNECHSLNSTNGAPDYFRTDAYRDDVEPGIRTYATSSLRRMTETPASPMPTADRTPMSAADIETFQNWVNASAPYDISDTGLVF